MASLLDGEEINIPIIRASFEVIHGLIGFRLNKKDSDRKCK